MTSPGSPIYRFFDIEVDPVRGCLRKAGEEIRLRQRTFQVLLYLLERPDRLVGKDEIIAALWKDTAVTDDALVQCVKDIRRAIGDDTRNPRCILTVPKSGYRFIAPLEEPDAPAAVTSPARSIPRRGLAAAIILVIVVVLVSAIGARVAWQRGLIGPRTRSDEGRATAPRVLVLPFSNLTGDGRLDWLREGLADMLITDFTATRTAGVVGRQQTNLLLDRVGLKPGAEVTLEQAQEISRRGGATTFVLGAFAGLGDKIRIDVALHDTGTGDMRASERLVVDRIDQVLTQLDLIAFKLGQRLGGPLPAKPARLTDITTTNLEAYHSYSRALERAEAVDTAEAIRLLERAVALDPEFAMGYARIGYMHEVHQGRNDLAKPYLEKAFAIAHRLTDRDRRAIAAWYAVATEDYEGAIRELRLLVGAYPEDVDSYKMLGRILNGESRFAESEEALKAALAIDPGAPDLYNALASLYTTIGRHDDAIGMAERYVALAPTNPNTHDTLGLAFQAAGRYEEATAAYTRALDLRPRFTIAQIHLASTKVWMGRYNDAAADFRRIAETAPAEVDRGRGLNGLTWIFWRKGQLDRADEAARAGLKISSMFPGDAMLVALARGDMRTASALRERLLASGPSNTRGRRLNLRPHYFCLGEFALHEGRPAEALEHFQQVLTFPRTVWHWTLYEDGLVRAYLTLGRAAEAQGEAERMLRYNPNDALATYYLGLSVDRRGDREQARASYRRFLTLWRDADADLTEIRNARSRLDTLTR